MMKKLLRPAEVEAAFRDHLAPHLTATGLLTPRQALTALLDFYQTTSIVGVDQTVPDYDMLLFQYGTYDWHDGNGPRFNLNVTRQFFVEQNEDEEFWQLRLTLYYSPEAGAGASSFNAWSINYPTLPEWAAAVQQTRGFQQVEELLSNSVEIGLSRT